jgi:probable 2-oxoglutarate dehydrogenase E1 component DHKTD1
MLRFQRAKSSLLSLKIRKAAYHYSHDDVYGYRSPRPAVVNDYTPEELENRAKNSNLLRLVHQYRANGHRLADLDPLNLQQLEFV